MGLVIHFLELQPFVVTLAGMFLARGLCYVISVESIPIRDPLFTAIAQGTVSLPGDTFVSPSVVIAVLVVAVGAYLLHATRFGRTVYAIGGNQQSAMLMGLRVGRTKVAVYAISGLCSAIGGLLFAFYSLSGYSLSAVGTELDGIAATVIGGTLLSGGVGLIVGSVLGVLVLGLIQTFISFEGTLSSWWTRIVIGLLLLVFVVLQRFLRASSELSCYDMRHELINVGGAAARRRADRQRRRRRDDQLGGQQRHPALAHRAGRRAAAGGRDRASGSPRCSRCSTASTRSPSRTRGWPRRPATSGWSRCWTGWSGSPGSPRWPGCRAGRSPRTAARGPTTSAACWSGRSTALAEQGLPRRSATRWSSRCTPPAARTSSCRRTTARPTARTRWSALDGFVADVLRDFAANGLEIGQLHAEYGPAQMELSLAATDPVTAADRQLLARQTLRAAAARHGLRRQLRPAALDRVGGQRLARALLGLARRGEPARRRAGRPARRGRELRRGAAARPARGRRRSPRPASARWPGCGPGTSPGLRVLGGGEPGGAAALRPRFGAARRRPRQRRAEDVGRVGQPLPRAGRAARRGRRRHRRRADAARADASPIPARGPTSSAPSAAIAALPTTQAEQEAALRNPRVAAALGPELLGAFLAVRRSDAAAAAGMEVDDMLAGLRFKY